MTTQSDSRNGEHALGGEHTPGPWRATYFGGRQCVLTYCYGDPTIVAEMSSPVDARLMAAAPAMLKVLKDVLVGVTWSYAEPGHASGLKTIVEHVIALAEGRA